MAKPRKSLKIAHVVPNTFDFYGYNDRDFGNKLRNVFTNQALVQAKMGHRPSVHFLASKKPLRYSFAGVDFYFHRCVQPPRFTSVKIRFARQVSFSMLFALQKDFFDIVHFHGVRNLHFMFAVVGWRTKKQKIPLVAQDHGYRSVGRIEKYMQRYGLSRTNAVLAANQESIDDFISQGFSSKLIYLVPDGFDPEIFYPGPPRLKPSAEPFQILVVSRLSEEKDPFTMAKGIVEVIKRGNLINLTICGNGPLKVQIEKSLKMASVPVKFIDHLPHEDLAEYYRCSDVLVLTSLHEGWPNAIVESIACGLPVIATNVPGSKDCLGEAGILITSRNPIALANALQNLIDNPELGLYYRDLGQKRAKNFTWEAVVKQIEQIYFKFI